MPPSFDQGDRVRATRDLEIDGRPFPEGSEGTVKDSQLATSDVEFDSDLGNEHLVGNDDLEKID